MVVDTTKVRVTGYHSLLLFKIYDMNKPKGINNRTLPIIFLMNFGENNSYLNISLNGIKFDLKNEGLYLTATDSELTIKIFIPEKEVKKIEQTGAIIIQSKYILDIIRKMPADVINFEVI